MRPVIQGRRPPPSAAAAAESDSWGRPSLLSELLAVLNPPAGRGRRLPVAPRRRPGPPGADRAGQDSTLFTQCIDSDTHCRGCARARVGARHGGGVPRAHWQPC